MPSEFLSIVDQYATRLNTALSSLDPGMADELAHALLACWKTGRRVFLCGNGGSAANALHLANDFHYGIGGGRQPGLRSHALPANVAILTCLANDESYAEIFSKQLEVEGEPGDILIVLSGSGNSPNIVRALEQAKRMGIRSFAVLGFDGGKAKGLADVPIHFAIDDMQISEDLQLAVGHILMQWLCKNPPEEKRP